MADYREISQEYARQGINAAFLLNGSAAVALLSQAAALRDQGFTGAISCGLLTWAAGTALAALTWIFAFMSSRFVDKSERETGMKERHLSTSDCFMFAGLISVIISISLFGIGCIVLARAFK